MTNLNDILHQLNSINADFSNDSDNHYTLADFSSFFYNVKSLPDVKQIIADFDAADEKILPTSLINKYLVDPAFNQEIIAKNPATNRQVMTVGLNVAVRNGVKKIGKYNNFHDKINITNTLRMNILMNDPRFRGCYMTDLIKLVKDSNSGNINHDFFITHKKLGFGTDATDEQRAKQYMKWDQANVDNPKKPTYKTLRFPDMNAALKKVRENRIIFNKSIELFIAECNIIKPERLVVFGDSAFTALHLLKNIPAIQANPAIIKLIDESIHAPHYSSINDFEKWCKTEPQKLTAALDNE